MSRRAALAVAAGAIVVMGSGALLTNGPLSSPAEAQSTPPPTGTATVTRKTLVATTQVDGTLGYADTYTVSNALATTGGGADGAAGDARQAFATARAQYDQAVAALHGLRHPTSVELGQLRIQVAQATAGMSQATATLRNDRAALSAAKGALTTCIKTLPPSATATAAGEACDAGVLRQAVTEARGRVDVDKAELASARAVQRAARTALSARQHPTSAQVRQARDALTAAHAALDAASTRLDQPRGVLTQVAPVGSIVQAGQTLYTLDGDRPVVLMTGDVPAWRDLQQGVADGVDVRQLEMNLETLGFAPDGLTVDDHWDADTTAAVEAWQQALGGRGTGDVVLGDVVFEPEALRITSDGAGPGATVGQGVPVLQASSTTPVVTVALDPALQTEVHDGDAVMVTMPDGSTASGSVTAVGTVATVPQGNNAPGANPTPTIAVTVALDDPASTGGLDQAPVTVNITTATANDVLAVPVAGLVALLEGGYAVQIRADDGSLHYVRVQLGLFANGWVEVTGRGLVEGETVIVPQ